MNFVRLSDSLKITGCFLCSFHGVLLTPDLIRELKNEGLGRAYHQSRFFEQKKENI
ncbi:MAG: hypothetical protein IPG09_13105 [Ignavibacteria bacterium]|nr:hypothetical protein [Ignavibacteria bacterium]